MTTQRIRPVRNQNPYMEQGNSVTTPVSGLLRDTIVLTRKGEVAVQDIRTGDHVITRSSGLVQVLDVIRYRVLMQTISIAAGSLGDTRPDNDLILPASQQVLIRDWRAQALFGQDQALVPASSLVDGEFIRDQGQQVLELFSLQLEHAHVIYAGGLEVAGATEPALDLRPAA